VRECIQDIGLDGSSGGIEDALGKIGRFKIELDGETAMEQLGSAGVSNPIRDDANAMLRLQSAHDLLRLVFNELTVLVNEAEDVVGTRNKKTKRRVLPAARDGGVHRALGKSVATSAQGNDLGGFGLEESMQELLLLGDRRGARRLQTKKKNVISSELFGEDFKNSG
jgi:hypothetical protein